MTTASTIHDDDIVTHYYTDKDGDIVSYRIWEPRHRGERDYTMGVDETAQRYLIKKPRHWKLIAKGKLVEITSTKEQV